MLASVSANQTKPLLRINAPRSGIALLATSTQEITRVWLVQLIVLVAQHSQVLVHLVLLGTL